MGGRGTFAAGNNVEYKYETVGKIEGVKVLYGKEGSGLHDLPSEAHSSNMYIKLHKDGTLNMLRIYDNEHYLTTEIAYHPEPDLTGNRKPVLHIHYYDRNFKRTDAAYLSKSIFDKYEKYLIGRTWYD
ncbi:MAG: hypothetical protein K2N72_01210 [Oscillospiraceae bacterium]|nr:hypothetical protein [Oscillospiraceae bacterium]